MAVIKRGIGKLKSSRGDRYQSYAWEEYQQATGSAAVKVVNNQSINNATYNLAGQRVDANYKGIVVKNGVKFMQK